MYTLYTCFGSCSDLDHPGRKSLVVQLVHRKKSRSHAVGALQRCRLFYQKHEHIC